MGLSVATMKRMKESASKSNTATGTTKSWHSTSSSTKSSGSTSSKNTTSSASSTPTNKTTTSSAVSYNKDTDYQAVINDAIARGDFNAAAEAERQRNAKIDGEGLSIEKTYNYTGHDVYDEKANNAYTNLENLTNQTSIISSGLERQMNKTFNTPAAVTKADRYLSELLGQIQSGKTSYTDQLNDIMNAIMNREKFSYDVDTDPLFQQALSSAMNSGKQAMQDTIGQASALTGGYGSTYATTAGNQAYNAFIEDAYDNLPQYYQMAMEAYQMEGDEMYRQFGMVSDLDDKEYSRYLTAFDATSQHRNQLYNEAYTKFRDNKNDAFAKANLRLNEYGQRVNAASLLYNAASDMADTMYQREYTSWTDAINNAWRQKEMDYNYASLAQEDKHFYEKLAQDDKWNQSQMDYNYASLAQEDKHFYEKLAQDDKWNQSQTDYNYASLAQEDKHFYEKLAQEDEWNQSSSGSEYELSTTEIKGLADAYNSGGVDGATAYLSGIGKAPYDDYSLSVIENLLAQEDIKADKKKAKEKAKKKANTPKSGTVSGFKPKEDDNFDVKIGKTSYRVENHGKETNKTTIQALNKLSVTNGAAFLYDGRVFVKHDGDYYKVGSTNILWHETEGYGNLVKALQKK